MTLRPGRVVALLGAESTGKSTLAAALRGALIGLGWPPDEVAIVPEYLREFCDAAGRTPRLDEQAGIAAEQTRRIAAAAERAAWVVADTTALMTAVYHQQVFGDTSLYPAAEAAHARVDLTLLTALDLPWIADGLQRDGPQVRGPVDERIRAALERIGRPYAVVHGQGDARARAALASWERAFGDGGPGGRASAGEMPAEATRLFAVESILPTTASTAALAYAPICERCGDAACERHLLPRA